MENEYARLAAILATYLAPFAPYLLAGGKKFAEKAGEATWQNVQSIWEKMKACFSDNKKIDNALTTLTHDPNDIDYQSLLAKALNIELEKKPDLADELMEYIRGEKSIQKVLADKSSWIEDITQDITGNKGQQIVQAKNDSVIKGVRQIKR